MSSKNNDGSSARLPRLDMTGTILSRREELDGAKDPYDSARSFKAPSKPLEVFRRRREDRDPSLPREREKRIKFEIVDDTAEGKADPGGGYDPYGHAE